MEDLEFNIELPKIKTKTKTIIVNVKKHKIKLDASTRLF